jgi:hypothetical protein
MKACYRSFVFLSFFFLSFGCDLYGADAKETAEWTMLVFAQAKNSLHGYAPANFAQMAKIGSNKKLNILVQLYSKNFAGYRRFLIEKGKMVLKEV